MRLDISVNKVAFAQELEGARQLLEKVTRDNLIEPCVGSYGVLSRKLVGGRVCDELVPLPDE